MKNFFYLTLAVLSITCTTPNQTKAQTTWDLEDGTVLTETDLVTGITLPWEILWGPDDYIWATQRNGRVLRIDPATGNYTTILNIGTVIPDNGGGEPGMLGMALHPDFINTPKVFVVYNYEVGNNVGERLVSYDWDGDALINEVVLIDEIPGYWIHNGSRLIITPDQKILMSTGDTGDGGQSSQDFFALNGKILRINLDGSIPSDNPDPSSYTYSYGHRNSQGLCMGPTGIIYSSEHGQSNSDEFNIIEPNRNYGWPSVEGACNTVSEQTFCDNNNVREPLKEWSPCVAVNGIEYYNHPAIPEWNNSIIMGVMGGLSGTSGNNDRVSVLHLSTDGLSVETESKYFTSLNQRFRDVCINPYTGALYVALNGGNYPGSGPNKIKEFRNMAYNAVEEPSATVGQKFGLFPNPAINQITVDVAATLVGSTLQIFGYNGELAKEVLITSTKQSIDITDLAKGSYWTMATSSVGTVTSNFIVQ
ncbi:MAG: PQQ-dependent sugar dehydrogenase [Flavobacteriales bacterium]